MAHNPFELTLLMPPSQRDALRICDVKSVASMSWTGPGGNSGTMFLDFPHIPATLLEDIAEMAANPGVIVKIGERVLFNKAQFVGALRCYLSSLSERDVSSYCSGSGVRTGRQVGCQNALCSSRCRLLCTSCMRSIGSTGSALSPMRVYERAVQAEVAWCPNFQSPWWG